jgi:hypothetical protein
MRRNPVRFSGTADSRAESFAAARKIAASYSSARSRTWRNASRSRL